MAIFVYTHITHKLATGALNLSTADLRVKLVCSNTTCGTERDVTSLAGFTTIDEYDGAGYTMLDLASVTVTKVDASDRTHVTVANGSFGSPSAATRVVKALLYIVRVDGTAANDYPYQYDDTPPAFLTGTFNGDGSPMTITFGTTGITHIAA